MYRESVITGIGVITCCSEGVEEFRGSLAEGRSGIGQVTSLDVSQYPSRVAGEIAQVKTLDVLDPKKLVRYGKASTLGIAATHLAIENANIDIASYVPSSIGVVIGSILADVQIFETIQYSRQQYSEIPLDQVPHYHPALNIAQYFGLQGINLTLSAACASGNYAVGYASDLINTGQADCVFCGGTDALSHITFSGFNRLRIMSPDKCRPFDRNRNGMILGEGACILVVEEKSAAIRRGADIYCDIAGYGLTCDAFDLSAPRLDGTNVLRAMKLALLDADLHVEDVGYINAHGTGTNANDRIESESYKQLFKDAVKHIPVSSIKSMIGHTMGAAGAIEAAACAIAIRHGLIPPTINYRTLDPECDLNIVTGSSMIDPDLRVAMNNSFGFGGANASLLLSRNE